MRNCYNSKFTAKFVPNLACLLLAASLTLGGCTLGRSASVPDAPPSSETTLPESPEDSDLSEDAVPEGNSETDSAEPSEEAADAPKWELCAYLPVSSAPDDLSPYAENIALLDYLVLNTGVYWNQDGELEISDDYTRVSDALSGQTGLWCTINPKGELIRSETAGDTINTPEERQALAEKIADFAAEQQLAGIDIDWEFPLESEWEDFSAFLLTLGEKLDDISVEISLALYPQEIALSADAVSAIDRVHVMAYDQFDSEGLHSTMQTAEDSVKYFLSLGFLPQQLVLGIPAYGRPLDGSAQWLLYSDIDLSQASAEDPNRVGDFYFNSPQLVEEKSYFSKEQKLGGVMIYHLLCDKTTEDSLIAAASKTKAES